MSNQQYTDARPERGGDYVGARKFCPPPPPDGGGGCYYKNVIKSNIEANS